MSYTFKFSFSLFLSLLAIGLTAQSALLAQLDREAIAPLVVTEATEAPLVAASFPGGNKALAQELSLNLIYPDLAREYSVEGTIVVRLMLDDSGFITEKKIIRSLGFGCDEAALKALTELPRWNAARRGNKRIAGMVYVPLRFRLQ